MGDTTKSAEANPVESARSMHLRRVLEAVRRINQIIVREEDPQRLIERACEALVETMSYHAVWIALVSADGDEDQFGLPEPLAPRLLAPTAFASAGFGGEGEVLRDRVMRRQFPACAERALRQTGIHLVEVPERDCPDCPVLAFYGKRASLVRRLEYDGLVRGLLVASVSRPIAADRQEQSLFDELAGDIAFGLHRMAQDRRRQALESVYVSLFENNHAVMLLTDPDTGAILEANPAAERFYGWPREILRRMDMREINTMGQGAIQAEAEDARLENRKHLRLRHRRAAGDVRDVEVYGGPVRVGDRTLLFSIIHDVTARREAEQRLKEGSDYFREVLDSVGEAVFVHDGRTGEIIDVNEASCRMYGHQSEDFVQLPVGKLSEGTPPYSQEDAGRWLARARTEGPQQFEWRARHRDGHCFWVEVNMRAVTLGGADRFVVVVRDIAERKRVEEELRESRVLLEEAESIAGLGAWHYHHASNTLIWSAETFRIFGIQPEEFTADYDAFITRVHPDDREAVGTRFRESLEPGGRPWEMEYRFLYGAAGEVRHAMGRCEHTRDASGRVERSIGIIMDITERKRAEDQLRTHEQRLALALRAARQGTYDVNVQTGEVIVSPEYATMLGYDPADFVETHQRWIERLHPDDVQMVARIYQDYAAGALPEYRVEFRQRMRDGGWKWILSVGQIIERSPEGRPLRMMGTHTDIDHTKRTEEALKAKTEELDRYFSNSLDLLSITSLDGRFLRLNPSWRETLGYELEELEGRNFMDFVHPEDLAATRTAAEAISRHEAILGFENRYRCRDGSWRWIEWRSRPLSGLVYSTARDVTKRREAEMLVAEGRDYLQAVFSSVSEGILMMDYDTLQFLDANTAACRMYGYRREDFLRLNVGDSCEGVPPFSRVEAKEWIERVRHEGPQQFEWRARHRDGHCFWVEMAAQVVVIGTLKRIAIVARDISHHKQMAQELRDSRLLLEEGMEVARMGAWQLDHATKALRWSPEVFALFGVRPGEFDLTQDVFHTHMVHPEDLPKVSAAFAESVRTHGLFEVKHRAIRRDTGEIRHMLERCVHYYGTSGRAERSMGIVMDITDREHAEQERERLQAQLLQSQKMESVGRLAGGVAHDFNNMLGVIIGHSEIALDRLTPADPLRADVEAIHKAAARSAELTRQLLAFARKQTATPRRLDLNVAVEGMSKMMRRLIGENIELVWRPCPTPAMVEIDPTQLDQILANLAVNARDAIGSQPGTITVSTEIVGTAHDMVRLRFSDTGCGMTEQVRSHLFEPFFTTKEQGKGTGLGLATIWGIVMQNKGTVEVDTHPGRGTTFDIELPRREPVATSAEPQGAAAAAPGSETILVVEDEPAILELASEVLRRQGYTVLPAATPGEALRIARDHNGPIHLLITDVVMPEMNGRELAKAVLSLQPRIRRLFMSGYTDDVIAHHGVLEEGVHFLQKPFSLRDLASKVRETLAAD